MFIDNLKKIREKNTDTKFDNVELDSFDNEVEKFKIFSTLRDIVSLFINSDTLGIDFNDMRDLLVEEYGEDEDTLGELSFYLERLLTYIKVPQSVIDDLLVKTES